MKFDYHQKCLSVCLLSYYLKNFRTFSTAVVFQEGKGTMVLKYNSSKLFVVLVYETVALYGSPGRFGLTL